MSLAKRFYDHKQRAKKRLTQKVYTHLNLVGWYNVRIVLIEDINAETKDQLLLREQHYIDLLKPSLNKNSAVGITICGHNRQIHLCVECGGSSICEHKRQRNHCIECGGLGICEHNRQRYQCVECNDFWCYECNIKFCNGQSLLSHEHSNRHINTYNRMFAEAFG